ncbi:ATP-binding cassette domain-containing protein [Aquabacterium sp. CECT 9606]|uniref:ATP-binding cassette domain-containing protein n=1 Tax=Aquabacterium sp. CECT 9606 TaxID=2845822 RepID=UPI001E380495|nr:ATP-binding cassette domain-containing protein [Aquabacterium sp. CECT 9606]CAH0354145.1 ABC transporter ATP-binding protein uup [Aquabacterium sp. CECT 9606]
MALLTLNDACLAFGHVALLDHTAFALESSERVGLIGRNGTGKSSLLKIIAGMEKLDDGVVQFQNGVRLAYVAQEPQFADGINVFDAVSLGLGDIRELRDRFEAHQEGDDLDALMTQIEARDGWNWEQRVEQTLQHLDLPHDLMISDLSGGMKKRVALAQALVASPDVLLLDEPTNHLDLNAITWLEELLVAFKGSVLLISHDRAFLDNVCTRIIELDRGILRSYPGNFAAYEGLKAGQLADEALANARFDKLLAQEEVWIRKGVEARRTRSTARIKRLEDLRGARAARRDTIGRVKLEVSQGDRGGKIVAELENVNKRYGDRDIVKNFTGTFLRGDKVGLVGSNGAGKTTLLKIILGELAPDSGKVKIGANINVAYFDQMRDNLDLNATLADFISPGSEWIEINGSRKHVMGYLQDFLFSPARANSPVRTLSGGERNRLLLARLFARPSNVLVLDEPTNDLDIDTLDLLEDLLADYPGTVFLVSHDRRFLDNVVTSTVVSEGGGSWREYEGGVQDWLIQSRRAEALANANAKSSGNTPPAAAAPAPAPAPAAPATPTAKPRKLSYKEQRELDELPKRIADLETEQASLNAQLADPDIYKKNPQGLPTMQERITAIDEELLTLLDRWEKLGQP